jgi:hypothetical protein
MRHLVLEIAKKANDMKRTSYLFLVAITLVLFHPRLFAQNVGIGNPNPTEKLDVSGNIGADTVKADAIKIAAGAGLDKVLTSDAQGNGTWQELSMQNDSGEDGNIGYGVWGDCQMNANISEYQPMADTAGGFGDNYGYSVVIEGDHVLVGAPTDDVEFVDQGSAHIYRHDGTEWQYVQRLTDSQGAAYDEFGSTVALSGNYAFIASGKDDEVQLNQGTVSVFQFDGVSWNFVQKLVDPAGGEGDYLGYNEISASGDFLIAGSPFDDIAFTNQGSASIFQYNGSTWEYMAKLTEADGSAEDWFGMSVSMSGDYCLIGVPHDDDGGTDRGSAMIFYYNGGSWNFQQKISDPQGAANDLFGLSVDIDGANIIVGAQLDDVGISSQGSACIFRRSATNWIFTQKINDITDDASDYFGASVAISGDYVLVGSIGSATLFRKLGAGWLEYQEFFDPAPADPNSFGAACALDMTTRRFLVSASEYNTFMGKVVFGKIR